MYNVKVELHITRYTHMHFHVRVLYLQKIRHVCISAALGWFFVQEVCEVSKKNTLCVLM